MTLVGVADTSRINYLLEAGYLEAGYIEVLPSLYGQVIIRTAVHGELSDRGSSDALRQWASAPPAWVSVQTPAASPRLSSSLHRGEMDAIAVAEELHAGLILMDDAAGVRYALELGLTITSTLGVLVEAAQNGWLQIDAALLKLKNTDFRATPGLYERARQLAFTNPPVLPRRKQE
jgi:predicted nucleic acid-binding protein